MLLKTHTDLNEIPADLALAYFQKGYFQSQSYSQFIGYSNEDFFIPFDITQEKAISIPRSPFGSIFRRKNATDEILFIRSVLDDLSRQKVGTVEIHHPSSIYDSFSDENSLIDNGFELSFEDINQHITLNSSWENSIHTMQKRKLESLKSDGFAFRKMGKDEYKIAHKFLTISRQAQGLQINISWDQLNTLIEHLPETYDCFGVFREDKISALCISVNVTSEIAYYYLPATSPLFRDKSPMVMLIAGMVDYYRNMGFKYLDLGVSSFEGKPQETLKLFKERMGAQVTPKPTLTKSF